MALPEFKNEQEFRDKWIAPFLAKLGFMNVKNTHGVGEQGKDFYFTDYDRFGHSRFYAAQVKLGNIGSGGKEITDLLDQVRRCFGVKLRFHKGAHEQRISAVYVMTSGTISEQARVRIHDWCQSENYGENVYFLDGEQLENKDRFSTYESDQEKRQHYASFLNELLRNFEELKKQKESFEGSSPGFRVYRLNALESELRRTPQYADIPANHRLEFLWHCLAAFNHFDSDTVKTLKITGNADVDNIKSLLQSRINDSIAIMQELIAFCVIELKRINDRYSLEATVIQPE